MPQHRIFRVAPPCPVCQRACRPYRGRGGFLKTCGRKVCQTECRRRRNRAPALAALRAKRDARVQAVVAFHFGKLSDRERALFRHVWSIAWKRGYEKGKYFWRAAQRKAAA